VCTAPSLEPTVTTNPTIVQGGGGGGGPPSDNTGSTDGTGTTERSGKKKTKKPSPSPSSQTARPTGKAMKTPTQEVDRNPYLFG